MKSAYVSRRIVVVPKPGVGAAYLHRKLNNYDNIVVNRTVRSGSIREIRALETASRTLWWTPDGLAPRDRNPDRVSPDGVRSAVGPTGVDGAFSAAPPAPRMWEWLNVDVGPGAPFYAVWKELTASSKIERIYEQPVVFPSPGGEEGERTGPSAAKLAGDLGGGEGARVAVLEGGWCLRHRALQRDGSPIARKAWGHNHRPLSPHGTSTLSVIAGQGDDAPGVAPLAAQVLLFGTFDKHGLACQVDALWAAIRAFVTFDWTGKGPVVNVVPGAVILLEMQGMLMVKLGPRHRDALRLAPAEVDPGVFACIRLATDLGITVIEPAGNGGAATADGILEKVGKFADPQSRADRVGLGPIAEDSGAIIVGAAQSDNLRLASSNAGPRVDVLGPGDGIRAATEHLNVRTLRWSHDINPHFGHTSAAAAFVAGLAARQQARHVRLPRVLRDELRAASRHNAGEGATQSIDPGMLPP